MKYIFSIMFLFLLFAGCSKDPVSPDQVTTNGKVLLKVDKTNAPSSVAVVTATLTRNGYDAIYADMNLQTDSSATLELTEVAAGPWHLKVDAKNNQGVVEYTGETGVDVVENNTIQVSLTLYPIPTEPVGGISISVTWAAQIIADGWLDYANNPVLAPSYGSYDFVGVTHPNVIYDNGTYKMWYAGVVNNGVHYGMYAESADGITWTKHSTPVLFPSQSGWDSHATVPGSVIKDGAEYKMYYTGWSDNNSVWSVGLATSTDGITWTKYPQPVLTGTATWEYQSIPVEVLKVDDIYYLYYNGKINSTIKLGLATSTDGINWTKRSEPVMVPTLPWEDNALFHPSIIKEENQFTMVYGDYGNSSFGMAHSSDGITWQKDSAPFFEKQNTSNGWGTGRMEYPSLLKIDNKYKIYYAAYGYYNDVFKIGFVNQQ